MLQDWLLATTKETTRKCFGVDFDSLLSHLNGDEPTTLEHMRSLFFNDYMDVDLAPIERRYRETSDIPGMLAQIEAYLVDHNGMSKRPMNLAIFLFAVEHVSRICRLLKQPGGHALLVGVGGSGRQSLARLAAFVCGMSVTQIEISKTYGKTEWREDLKAILRKAGGEMQPGVFLFSDTQIKVRACL